MPSDNTFALSDSHRRAAAELRKALSGRLTMPGDSQYENSRKVWNQAVSRQPAFIAFCESAQEVAESVRVARRNQLSLSVRGGGHDWTGRALCDGLVIDLTRMSHVSVDPQSSVATVAGGATAREVASAAGSHNLLAALGGCGGVGMAGFTLGGGYGPLNGLYGFAADNLLEAQVVLSDGHIVNANPNEEPELFWAIRGGGGNFGVVTSLRIQLHERHQLLAGPIIFPLDDGISVLQQYAAFAATAPDELGIPVSLNSGPGGQPALLILPLWNGDRAHGERVLRELQSFGTPKFAQVGSMNYSDLLAIFDASVDALADCHWAARTRSLPAPLAPGAIEVIVRAASRKTSPYSMINWHHCHGASIRAALDKNAFGLRQEHFMVEIFAGWKPTGDDGKAHREWANELWQDLAPYALPSSYPAFLESSDQEHARSAYGRNGDRLRELKKRFDPDGLFASAIPLPL